MYISLHYFICSWKSLNLTSICFSHAHVCSLLHVHACACTHMCFTVAVYQFEISGSWSIRKAGVVVRQFRPLFLYLLDTSRRCLPWDKAHSFISIWYRTVCFNHVCKGYVHKDACAWFLVVFLCWQLSDILEVTFAKPTFSLKDQDNEACEFFPLKYML